MARTFADGLRQVAGLHERREGTESALIDRLMAPATVGPFEPAPFEALWPHADTFLTACVYIAMADGDYSVEEARQVSLFAHRLGLSARQLARLEARVFRELAERGASVRERDAPPAPSPERRVEPRLEQTLMIIDGALFGDEVPDDAWAVADEPYDVDEFLQDDEPPRAAATPRPAAPPAADDEVTVAVPEPTASRIPAAAPPADDTVIRPGGRARAPTR